jgi:DNA-directed RNA polymerase specialized sigma24 family protein
MSKPPRRPTEERSLLAIHAELVRSCRRQGLTWGDAEDVAQDIWLWLVREHRLELAASIAWTHAVVKNFVLRYRRRAALRARREPSLDGHPLDHDPSQNLDVDARLSVGRLERLLPALEARIVHEMRSGATWSEAATISGVPAGSRDWLRKRIAGRVREAFSARPLRGE